MSQPSLFLSAFLIAIIGAGVTEWTISLWEEGAGEFGD